jgi:hypothetical protein
VDAATKAAAASAIPTLQRENRPQILGEFDETRSSKNAAPQAAKAKAGTPNNTPPLAGKQASHKL